MAVSVFPSLQCWWPGAAWQLWLGRKKIPQGCSSPPCWFFTSSLSCRWSVTASLKPSPELSSHLLPNFSVQAKGQAMSLVCSKSAGVGEQASRVSLRVRNWERSGLHTYEVLSLACCVFSFGSRMDLPKKKAYWDCTLTWPSTSPGTPVMWCSWECRAGAWDTFTKVRSGFPGWFLCELVGFSSSSAFQCSSGWFGVAAVVSLLAVLTLLLQILCFCSRNKWVQCAAALTAGNTPASCMAVLHSSVPGSLWSPKCLGVSCFFA